MNTMEAAREKPMGVITRIRAQRNIMSYKNGVLLSLIRSQLFVFARYAPSSFQFQKVVIVHSKKKGLASTSEQRGCFMYRRVTIRTTKLEC